jgi:hypothetical protein
MDNVNGTAAPGKTARERLPIKPPDPQEPQGARRPYRPLDPNKLIARASRQEGAESLEWELADPAEAAATEDYERWERARQQKEDREAWVRQRQEMKQAWKRDRRQERQQLGQAARSQLPADALMQEVDEKVDEAELKTARNTWDALLLDADEFCRYRGRITPRHVAEYISAVDVTWGKSAAARIETGRALQTMKSALKHGEWLVSFKQALLPFSIDSAQHLMLIARHPVLGKTENSRYLPNKREPLLMLAKSRLPAAVIDSLIKSGVINATMSIADVKGLSALRLPGLVNELLAVAEKSPDAVAAAEEAGFQLFREGQGNTLSALYDVARWMKEFTAAYAALESRKRGGWLRQIEAEDKERQEERQNERLTKTWRTSLSDVRRQKKGKRAAFDDMERYVTAVEAAAESDMAKRNSSTGAAEDTPSGD